MSRSMTTGSSTPPPDRRLSNAMPGHRRLRRRVQTPRPAQPLRWLALATAGLALTACSPEAPQVLPGAGVSPVNWPAGSSFGAQGSPTGPNSSGTSGASSPTGPTGTPVSIGDEPPVAPVAVCPSGVMWTHGNSGSSRMRPGGDCIGCHRQDEGPRYAIAGTVFDQLHIKDDCYGVAGAIVEVTGSNGQTVAMETNSVGNFGAMPQHVAGLQPPYTTRVWFGDQVRDMDTPITDLNCAGCHTVFGAQNAPGRVVVPH